MKKYLLIYLFAICLIFQNVCFADNSENIDQKLFNIGLFSVTQTDDKAEIENLFKKQSRYANSRNLKKLQAQYAENYKNFDGFSREDYFKMVKQTWDFYTHLSYTTEIKDIRISGIYADVEVIESAKGKTKEAGQATGKIGQISSQSTIIYNLQKFGKNWKIVSDNILREQTYLLYGEANNLSMNLNTPSQIAKGEQYSAIFDVTVPKGYYALASITNEDIVYPQRSPHEVFRNVKQDTALERVLTSNSNNRNEYAIASIGLTKPIVEKEKEIHIDIVGMGFLMNRVNVLPLTKGN